MRPLGPGHRLTPDVRVLGHMHRSRVLDVYDGFCERRAARVVVKTLRPDRLGDARARRALIREGRLLRRLSHPNLVRAYEVRERPRALVVLETIGGETLQHLAQRRRLPAAELAVVAVQLGGALRYLHASEILHLDVKPGNAIADPGGAAKLIDLSIARPPGRVRAGRGTWASMAPEQARGGAVGPPADVWGLGTVLYELAAGAPPFADDGGSEHPQLRARAAPIRATRRLAAPLADAIDGCLAPDPAARPDLDALISGLAPLAG